MRRFKIWVATIALFLVCSAAVAYRMVEVQTATAVALAWSIGPYDEFDCARIAIKFNTAPTTAGSITVTLDSNQGAAYDTVLRTANPVGVTSVVFENVDGQVSGDKLLVSYTNADLRSITGTATCAVGTY